MGANIAGIYGAQILRQDDRPKYRRGFSVNIGVLCFGLSLAVIGYIDDRIHRRRASNMAQENSSGEETADEINDGQGGKRFERG